METVSRPGSQRARECRPRCPGGGSVSQHYWAWGKRSGGGRRLCSRRQTAKARWRTQKGNPISSVDCKKKELIGTFKNHGREWQAKGEETSVKVYVFLSLASARRSLPVSMIWSTTVGSSTWALIITRLNLRWRVSGDG